MKKKFLLCKLGFHSPDKQKHWVRYSRKNKSITSRSAMCKRCHKKLYLIDKYGNKKEV